jgi:hypothetical protein
MLIFPADIQIIQSIQQNNSHQKSSIIPQKCILKNFPTWMTDSSIIMENFVTSPKDTREIILHSIQENNSHHKASIIPIILKIVPSWMTGKLILQKSMESLLYLLKMQWQQCKEVSLVIMQVV